jgi:hypothetical protein
MHISIPDKSLSNEAIEDALIDEIKKGIMMEQYTENARIERARKEALETKGKTHPVLGRCIATIPARDYFRLVETYGRETVHSKEFLQFFNRKLPDLSPNRI